MDYLGTTQHDPLTSQNQFSVDRLINRLIWIMIWFIKRWTISFRSRLADREEGNQNRIPSTREIRVSHAFSEGVWRRKKRKMILPCTGCKRYVNEALHNVNIAILFMDLRPIFHYSPLRWFSTWEPRLRCFASSCVLCHYHHLAVSPPQLRWDKWKAPAISISELFRCIHFPLINYTGIEVYQEVKTIGCWWLTDTLWIGGVDRIAPHPTALTCQIGRHRASPSLGKLYQFLIGLWQLLRC